MGVTLKDIAERARVSRSTAGWVLSGRADEFRISQATRAKVLKISQEMDYHPSFIAKSLVKGKTYTLGLLCGDFQTPFFSELSMAAMMAAEKKGYHLLLSVTQWDKLREIKCFEMLMQRQVDGILMLTGALTPDLPHYKYISQQKFPVVMVNTYSTCDDIPMIMNDWATGFRETILYLKQKGHRKIGMVRQKSSADCNLDPKNIAFIHVCEAVNVEWRFYDCGTTLSDAIAVAGSVAEDRERPSAFIIYSDYVTMGVFRELRKRKLRVPDDIALVGMNGTRMGEIYDPSLSSIDQGIANLAEKSIELLLKQVADRNRPSEKVVLPTHLIIRETA